MAFVRVERSADKCVDLLNQICLLPLYTGEIYSTDVCITIKGFF